jgi:formate hydrogenlyase transcriptional activator
MSSPLLPSALDARTQAFPVLSVSQIDRIRSCGRSRHVAAGDILFEPGNENVPFYVLLSGRMEIVQPDLAGELQIAKHGPGEFTGEMTMISGRRCLVRGRVTEPGEFLELTGDGLRSLVARDAELSEIFMRAFILRRLELISRGQGNLILLGSRHSANTLRLREFLNRNGHPYSYVDLDTDNTSQELLDRFAVAPSEIPVVICSGRSVLRNPSNQELADCLGFNATINESQVRDLIIVGAGPAGLAAAVYAGSEGLDVLMIETAALQTAFEQIKAEETELRRMTDAIASYIYVLRPDGTALYANQTVLDYTGLTLEDVQREDQRARVFHPEDVERLREERHEALARGKPFEIEQRALGKDGKYRWFLIRYNPLRDDGGHIIRWYATGTDIEDRKRAEERMRDENLALREQIDQAFMFEEIVGASPALQTVLSSIVKVAPTDSTVLITGETGTGKELIARAIHKHSQRSGHAFISVNCASIPSSLIASELFGHEKGAFTGAVQRRQGRFEMAHSGTIFLDEVGELPAETQIALLRVLQERQFERVGGNRIIPTDVRIIAATNRDLTEAIATGTFRADLFYRLDVFPIEVPPLRKRKEDIPMLVEYFVKRCAEKAGKQICKVDNNTLELCQLYPWPGNIRELQNIVERSVILCGGDTFWIEKAWLARVHSPRQELAGPLPDTLQNQEKEIIEAALAESNGKVAGPEGAAAKLGIPRSTLDSKIKQLNIKKHKFLAER